MNKIQEFENSIVRFFRDLDRYSIMTHESHPANEIFIRLSRGSNLADIRFISQVHPQVVNQSIRSQYGKFDIIGFCTYQRNDFPENYDVVFRYKYFFHTDTLLRESLLFLVD